jgi:hypothetical protein
MNRLIPAAAATLLALAPLHTQAALLRLDFTASLTWGAISDPWSVTARASHIQNATGITGATPFTATGHITIDTAAPSVVGFAPATGYWSSDAFNEVSFTIGSQTFAWGNAPGTTNTRYGLILTNSATTDQVSTGSRTGPFGGIDRLQYPEIVPIGVSVPEPTIPVETTLRLSSLAFALNIPGLISSNILADQGFDWGSIPFTSANNSLQIQIDAETPPEYFVGLRVLAQNASGHFTSLSLRQETTPTPEPASLALLLAGTALLATTRRRG